VTPSRRTRNDQRHIIKTARALILFSMIFSRLTLRFIRNYGRVTARTLPVKVPPVYVPVYFSAMRRRPADAPRKFTVKVPDAPAAIVPTLCGNGDPEAEPSVAVTKVTLDAGCCRCS